MLILKKQTEILSSCTFLIPKRIYKTPFGVGNHRISVLLFAFHHRPHYSSNTYLFLLTAPEKPGRYQNTPLRSLTFSTLFPMLPSPHHIGLIHGCEPIQLASIPTPQAIRVRKDADRFAP
ncbi:hypothetical protein AVEN_134348-1 [Araneus ventricosus]|uniref:Uncharacterized protein n=1 Tax=Araneus ventricosus TaxID=182803 RepID=A0A4Y2J682_ARAVE|nr:hypothetical protein AVEN_134348-1 [Araneus ventricosus]